MSGFMKVKMKPDVQLHSLTEFCIFRVRLRYLDTFATKMFLHTDFFFKLARQKCDDLLLPQICKNMEGNRLSFGENMPRRTT